MKKYIKIVVISILLIFGAVLLSIYLSNSKEPSIKFLFPKGGETLITSSTQTLKWETKNIPSSNKISITIRRVAPAPLQTEGQEFDPIVFINLPDIGYVNWTISDMYPSGTYVLGIESYESLPMVNPISAESKEFIINKGKLVGGDKDIHGCIGSAGYSWCEEKQICIRPWEQYCTSATPKTVIFYCDDSRIITASFYIGDDKFVDLVLSDDRKLSVPRVISASGARYANADETFVFWNKGETAFITEGINKSPVFTNCIIKTN